MKESTTKKLLQQVTESYNQIANEFSDTRNHPWEEFKYFQEYLHPEAEIIDLGCGNGRLLNFLNQHYLDNKFQYIGIDNNQALLAHAQKKFPQSQFFLGDQLAIPREDNSIDIIMNIAAFHHLPSHNLRSIQVLLASNMYALALLTFRVNHLLSD